MPQQPKRKPKLDREALLSPTGAAELFHRDRATLKRALRNVEPDAFEGGQPRFKLSTILEAMEDHNRTTGRSRSAAAASPIEAELGALEQADLKFKAFLKRLRLERRRAFARSEGNAIGVLDQTFEATVSAQGRDAVTLYTPLRNHVTALAINELCTLCEWNDARAPLRTLTPNTLQLQIRPNRVCVRIRKWRAAMTGNKELSREIALTNPKDAESLR